MSDFNPSLRNTSGNTWEASIRLPVVGDVTTSGNGWEEAKMRLWLVAEAVKMLSTKQCADPKDWTEDQWRSTLKTMINHDDNRKFKMITQGLDRQYHADEGELSKNKNTVSYGLWKKRWATRFVWGVWSKELGDEAKALNQKQFELDEMHDAFEKKLEASKVPLFQNDQAH